MLRWMPRWQPIKRLALIKPRPFIRMTSNETKPNQPQQKIRNTWLRRRFSLSVPVLHEPPFPIYLRLAIYALVLMNSVHVFFTYVYEFDSTQGISMLPTLASFGDWVFISKYYRRGRGVKAGDVVSFKHPVRIGENAIKRVLAMEGDFVLMNTPGKSEAMIQVPQGHCWVVGDNMLHSRDSRMFGPLPLALISGKVMAKVDRPGTLPGFSWIEHGFQPAYIEDDDVD
ncbi:hypothetical protein M409DRAFT_24286 [Zasmidium cellare ATCC 36951]|uniref:Mitochondrial inner membrane protease subunit n=1 Tax=Zasmidium cellare ATCC 36951 TaxID=1080233 RepID=A0A6A6CJ39_ZASCE|nr:uncharacterized protein M409DRAFT_24286 [Zasmidium cellare ATCC 36951]KAF2165436.1 hypothetical protein M409DRAFT_24286 [Zasmidium cellare ATCC 36951]